MVPTNFEFKIPIWILKILKQHTNGLTVALKVFF